MANITLASAKNAKIDEFYTQLPDIQKEVNAYLDYDKDVFRDKTILLPCDDPEWSNFTKFFAQNFQRFGLKKLISTSYSPNTKKEKYGVEMQLSLFEEEAPQYDAKKSLENGRIFVLERKDINGDGRIDFNDLQWKYLNGDGDFRSEEVKKLRDEADIIITNPPFSLFREFLSWVLEANKKFLVIANKNAITYKEIFPLIQDNQIWAGATPMSIDILFEIPKVYEKLFIEQGKEGSKYKIINGKLYGRSPSIWLSNLDHGRRHQPLSLMTMADNLKYSKHKEIRGKESYQKYDNYDAIEVPFTDAIPRDYEGLMGVPISFLDKYCPEQFEIVGLLQSSTDEQAGIPNLRYYNDFIEMKQGCIPTGQRGGKANGNPVLKGKSLKGNFLFNELTNEYVHSVYARVLIKRRNS